MLKSIVIPLAISFAVAWLALAVTLVFTRPDDQTLRDAARLPVDVVRFVRRVLAAPGLRRRTRIELFLLIGYLLMPFDLIPDFIPVIGYADDVVVIAILMRGALRAMDRATTEALWPGTPVGLDTLRKLCRVDQAKK